MRIRDWSLLAQVLLGLLARDPRPPSPEDVLQWAGARTLRAAVLEHARAVGVDASALAAVLVQEGERFDARLAVWSGVIRPRLHYGLDPDGPNGWLLLLWAYVDLVDSRAATVEAD